MSPARAAARATASLRWSHHTDDSNVTVISYDRRINGVYITYRLKR